jgi:hypothetical protein
MKSMRALSICFLLVLYGTPLPVRADALSETFALPDAQAAAVYRMSIEKVLGERYGLRLETGRRTSVFRWAFTDGEMPPGVTLRPSGVVAGVPRSPREQPYNFRIRVVDVAVGSEALVLNFSLKVNATSIRLSRINAPRLVPAAAEAPGDFGVQAAPIEATGPTEAQREKVSVLITPMLFQSSKGVEFPQLASRTPTLDVLTRAEALKEPTPRTTYVTTEAVSPVMVMPTAAAVSCSVVCNPTPAPDATKDYIIDAIAGTTRGKTKFGRGDRVRIIVINKNPFLYDYKITIQETPVAEPALAAFLDLLPIGGGTFLTAKPTPTPPQANAPVSLAACPFKLEEQKLSADEEVVKAELAAQTADFNKTQTIYQNSKDVLTNPGVQCPQLCTEADTLRSNLNNYLSDILPDRKATIGFKTFEEHVQDFEKRANKLKAKTEDDNDCKLESKLADHYLKVAGELQAKLKVLRDGRKVFADMVKSIGVVFSTANAFYDVYERGDFDVPTDVSIKIERKAKTQADSDFAKLVDTKLNFGGGPRFTLAGGLVVSPLAKTEYERVPAVVNGQTVSIVGFKESSNSRILPLLMLHGRLFSRPNWKYVSGIHMSLGLTAKPDNEGTDAEFLIGPSISFIEERLFFTFGGYAGRKQELEGNLSPGQQIPADFGNELPISKHYVWKPGFALTYKIK